VSAPSSRKQHLLAVTAFVTLSASDLVGCTEPQFRLEDSTDAAQDIDAGASEGDSGGPPDATSAEPDAMDRSDAGPVADARFERAMALCKTDAGAALPGDVCADSVVCGNAKACDVGTHNCCLAFGGFGDECSLDPCTTAGQVREKADCDGPEDCPFGTRCCFGAGSTTCEASCARGGALCHADPDCVQGRCAVGRPDVGGVRFWTYWGFCES
jgi:hypothetical protein